MNRFFLAGLAGFLTLSACDSNDPETQTQSLDVQTATDINADAGPRDPMTGQVQGTARYALYDLNAGELVLGIDEDDRSDSLSTVWDIGFNGTTVIVNGGTSGPGQAEAQIVATPFDALTEAPEDGYRTDGEGECPAVMAGGMTFPGTPRAVCTGSGNGWYTYVPFQTGGGYITPTAGRTLVVLNADGRTYSKVQFVSYYQGNPAPADITPESSERYYTFRFVTQPDGSRDFLTTDVDA